MNINEILISLREAAHTGEDLDAQWQNLVDTHTVMGCHPEGTFYVESFWDSHKADLTLDWVCAQWFDLPEDRWEKKFAEKHADVTEWRYIVKTPDLDNLKESYYIQKVMEHDPESNMPITRISWLECCALANLKSIEAGLKPVYYFNEERQPLTSIESHEVNSLYEDEDANGVRIPDKEEWITACLAGRLGQDTPWGNHSDFESSKEALDPYCWFYENSKGKMHPVGTKLPNQWGIEGMLGNAFEFTSEEA